MKNLFSLFSKKAETSSMSDIEAALVKSVNTEPAQWVFERWSTPGEGECIKCTNRVRGMMVMCKEDVIAPRCYNRKAWTIGLKFSSAFADRFAPLAEERVEGNESRQAEASRVAAEAALRKALGL